MLLEYTDTEKRDSKRLYILHIFGAKWRSRLEVWGMDRWRSGCGKLKKNRKTRKK